MERTAPAGWAVLSTPVHQDVPDVEAVTMPWRDNAIFFWWDPDEDVYGVLHVSTSPGGRGCRARCSVTIADRARELVEPLEPGTFQSESIRVDLDGHLRVDHDMLTVDIRLAPVFAPMDFTHPRALGAAAEDHPLHHHQHAIQASGTVILGDDTTTFSGHGWRDRTWGFRDESAQWNEYCAVTTVFPDEAMVLLKMRLTGGDVVPVGYHLAHGRDPLPITGIDITRDGAGLLATARATGDGFDDIVLRKVRRTAGHWTPMGDGGAGPVFSAYNEFMVLERADGERAAAMSEHGILRTVT